ncbi:hypothetical protein N7G274_010218 [Stereocaulon virgatum]|uniref:Uncharacterized protein n=1 Tax=Stereocaulon virgatum TaxID=373712 RepID=A0ABR3ZW02_9LECA
MGFDVIQSFIVRSVTMNTRHYLLIWSALSLHLSCVFSQPKCDSTLYGRPNPTDCLKLYEQLPGGPKSPQIRLETPRFFVEPKFLLPSFSPVSNPFRTDMVQLPKLWRQGTCRCALMSVADKAGVVHQPTSVDTWRTILDAVIDDVTSCVIQRNGAGGVFFANVRPPHAKVVYIYAQGSAFEKAMNFYMSSYVRGLDPNEPVSFLGRSAVVNSSIAAG